MRINLRGRQVRVAEHHLDRAEIRAALQEMRREGMTEHVRAERTANAGAASVRLEIFPEAHPRQRAAASVEKQARRCSRSSALPLRDQPAPAFLLITAHPFRGLFTNRNDALLAAFAHAGEVLLVETQIDGTHFHEL